MIAGCFEIITVGLPFCAFKILAGLGLNLYQSDPIYKAMSREAKYPEELFAGKPETLDALKARITASLGGASF